MQYLTKEEIITINRELIHHAGEGTIGLQYPEGLDIVIDQPQMKVFGKELYPTLWLKAAFILQKITKSIFSAMTIKGLLMSVPSSFSSKMATIYKSIRTKGSL